VSVVILLLGALSWPRLVQRGTSDERSANCRAIYTISKGHDHKAELFGLLGATCSGIASKTSIY
jgi:hypothetical protein